MSRVLPPGRQYFFFTHRGHVIQAANYPTDKICLGVVPQEELTIARKARLFSGAAKAARMSNLLPGLFSGGAKRSSLSMVGLAGRAAAGAGKAGTMSRKGSKAKLRGKAKGKGKGKGKGRGGLKRGKSKKGLGKSSSFCLSRVTDQEEELNKKIGFAARGGWGWQHQCSTDRTMVNYVDVESRRQGVTFKSACIIRPLDPVKCGLVDMRRPPRRLPPVPTLRWWTRQARWLGLLDVVTQRLRERHRMTKSAFMDMLARGDGAASAVFGLIRLLCGRLTTNVGTPHQIKPTVSAGPLARNS